jgi:hypothetical protein
MSWLWQGHGQYSIGTVPWHATVGEAIENYKVPVDKALECGASASTTHDYQTASHWYLYAEREGNVRASVLIGILLVNGPPGVPKDYLNALKRFEFAGSKGDTLGMNNAALIYQGGLGVAINPQRVKYWNDRMAERRQQFYLVCSSSEVQDTMKKLLDDSRSDARLSPLHWLDMLFATAMQLKINAPGIDARTPSHIPVTLNVTNT